MRPASKVKVEASAAFLAIAAVGYLVRAVEVPLLPWHGVYRPFWVPMLLLAGAGVLLLVMNSMTSVRFAGAVLLAAAIGTIPLQWGTFWGIRDPWVHLARINAGGYVGGGNPYPAVHVLVDVLSQLTGIGAFRLLNLLPVFAAVLGVLLVGALAYRLSNRNPSLAALAAIAFVPIVIVDHIERPFSMVPVVVALAVYLTVLPKSKLTRGLLTAGAGIVLVVWHPTALLVFAILTIGVTAVGMAGLVLGVFDSSRRKLEEETVLVSPAIVVAGGVLLGIHLFYVTDIGTNVVEQTVAALPTSSGTGTDTSAGGGEGRAPMVVRALDHTRELVARAGQVIVVGAITALGMVLAVQRDRDRVLVGGSLLALVGWVAFFVAIDFTDFGGFGPHRAAPIAPMILLPGVLIGLTELHRRSPRATTCVAAAVLLIGVAVIFPSPALGTEGLTSSPADVERTDWLIDHGSSPVADSQNTYVIAEGRYGQETADGLANDSRGQYQRNTRPDRYPWEVDPPDAGGLYVIHTLTRLHVDQWESESAALRRFETRSNRVYASGNSDVYWSSG